MCGYKTNSGCIFHQHLLTDMNQGWCQTKISILLTAHLCLINDWARCCHGDPAERPSGVHSVSLPPPSTPDHFNPLLRHTRVITPSPWLPYKVLAVRFRGCIGYHKHLSNTNIGITLPVSVSVLYKWIYGCHWLQWCTVACSSWALGIKRLPCSQVKRAPLFTNGTPANDLDSLKMSALSRTLKCIIMHLFQWNCHYSVG